MKNITNPMVEDLNNIINLHKERVRIYEKASIESSDENLAGLYKKLAFQSAEMADDLRIALKVNYGIVLKFKLFVGKFKRTFLHAKSIFTSHPDDKILDTCSNAEELIKSAYENVLERGADLLEAIKELLLKHYSYLSNAHKSIRELQVKDGDQTPLVVE